MTFPAHAGHWLVSLLYVMPVVVIVGALAFQAWRDRRRGRDAPTPEDGGPEPAGRGPAPPA